MKKKNVISQNYLEKIPMHPENLKWSVDADGKVTLEIENTGIFNKIAQKLFKKPRVSYIHLDENGSFAWQIIDGDRTIIDIGQLVEQEFGEKAHPLYERLAKFFQILESYGFIKYKE